jgi:large subunit ribosomal protein L28
MPKVCQITGKKALVGNNVSHAMNKTKRRFEVNLIKKRFYLTDQEKWITLKLSTSALKTINKKGLAAVLKEAKAQRRPLNTLSWLKKETEFK